MSRYVFLLPFLPPLSLDKPTELSFEELIGLLQVNLSRKDLEKIKVLRLAVDLSNIRDLLLGKPIDSHGNFSEKELDEALLLKSDLPQYVFDFLDPFEDNVTKLKNFWGLFTRFFVEEIAKQKGFLKSYLTFERESRLVLLGLRAIQAKKDLLQELQFEDPLDPFVKNILLQKDLERYTPPPEYARLKEIFFTYYKDPWEQYQAFTEYRFASVADLVSKSLFSMDHILCYVAQFMLVESLYHLDKGEGEKFLETFQTG
ncbi:MAG: DUF2764 domain-containing protein [Chlamydiales bacterium]|jgi:hypothetical protein|nr:DUF2764 domain-containing protein [Chlamydiales bacterium]